MPDPKYLSNVEMPDGSLLEIKDTVARQMAASGTRYIGKLYVDGTTYTHLSDNDTRTSVEIVTGASTHESHTAEQGDIVLDDGKEFIYDGSVWEEMGVDNLGAFAFVNEGRVTVPTVSYGDPTPNQTSTAATVNIQESANGNLAITGTFTQPTISGSASVTGSSTHNTSSKDYAVTSSTTIPSGKTKNYTPAGSVSAPTITLATAGTTTTVKNPTSKTVVQSVSASNPGTGSLSGEVVYMNYTENTETLSFKRLAAPTGSSINTTDVTVKNGDASYTAGAPTFTGTDVYMDVKGVQVTAAEGTVSASGAISATATGGAYAPKKYQVDVNYDKTTSVTQGTKTEGTVTKVVTPYTGT